jgi:hypothetical protein
MAHDQDLNSVEEALFEAPETSSKNDRTFGQEKPEEANDSPKDAVEHEYPGPWALAAIMIALYFATFLVALVGLYLFIWL